MMKKDLAELTAEPAASRDHSVAEHLATVIASIDEVEPFAEALVRALEALSAPRHAHVIVFRGRDPRPLKLWFRPANADVSSYRLSVYDLDPVTVAVRGGRTGLIALHDVVPSGFEKSALFKEIYESKGILDELSHYPGPRHGLGVIACVSKSSRFTSDEIFRHEVASPVVGACLLRLADLLGRDRAQPDHGIPENVDTAVEQFGAGVLSEKEQEVIHLILRGHDSESVAQHLGIAWNTVRGHRQRAYRKLHVSSQGELFFEFLRSIGLQGTE